MSTGPQFIPDRGVQSFLRSFAMQMNVTGALLMRELHTRYGRENVGYLWVILEPMMFASAVAVLHAGQPSHYGTDLRPVPFTILGYTIFIMFRGIFGRAEGALEANMPLLYHRMVSIFDILLSRALLEGAGTLMTLVILLGLAHVTGLADPPQRVLYLLIAVLLMFWFSFAMSMLCCALTHDNRLAGRLIHPLTYILMPISGGFYLLKWIPEPYREWLWYLPLVQIFELARYGQFASATDEYFSIAYIAGTSMFLTFLGLLAIKITRRHVHLR